MTSLYLLVKNRVKQMSVKRISMHRWYFNFKPDACIISIGSKVLKVQKTTGHCPRGQS